MRKITIQKVSLLLLILTMACMPGVPQIKTNFVSVQGEKDVVEMSKDISINLPTGYSRTLLRGSKWEHYGIVPEGKVYRPLNQTFTIEGTHIHEAYIVESQGMLVGFYLPVEGSFSSLEKKIMLSIK
jgi:hypothetical protein